MTIYATNVSLLDGAVDPDGDPLEVYQVNGAVPPSWPAVVPVPTGQLLIERNGTVTYDDQDDTTGHPSKGGTIVGGSFTFSIWDGTDASPAYNATVNLTGQNAGPTGQSQTLGFAVHPGP